MKPLTLFARQAVLLRPTTRPTPATTTTTTQAASQLLLHLRQTPFSTAARALLQRNTSRLTQHLPVLLRRLRSRHPLFRRYSTPAPRTTYNPTPALGSPEPALSLSQRMKKLSREYGWSALGVYLALSALDFPFCFLAVRLLGTDRIGRWEHAVVQALKDVAGMVWPQVVEEKVGDAVQAVQQGVEGDEQGAGWGVEEAEKRNNSNATLWTQLALAYAIHKSFIFLRVPLTAAVTPKVVKVLRGWGWNIGKRKPKTPPTSDGA